MPNYNQHMDEGTIGDSPAERTLNKLLFALNEPKVSRTVMKLLYGAKTDIQNLQFHCLRNLHFYRQMLSLLRANYVKMLDSNELVPIGVKSYWRNSLLKAFKQAEKTYPPGVTNPVVYQAGYEDGLANQDRGWKSPEYDLGFVYGRADVALRSKNDT